jgi:hypothetical protein
LRQNGLPFKGRPERLKNPFMLKKIPFHVLFVALYPMLAIAERNVNDITFSYSYLLWLFVYAIVAGIVYGIAFITFRDRHRAGFAALTIVIVLFFYGDFYAGLKSFGGWWLVAGRHRFLVPGMLLLIGVAVRSLVLIKESRGDITLILNITSIVLLALPVSGLSLKSMTGIIQPESGALCCLDSTNLTVTNGLKPDVYYIILDRYPSNVTLRKIFSFDNSDFTDQLSARGFIVADNRYSNYARTQPSLASSLSMDYLQKVCPSFANNEYGRASRCVNELIRHNHVARLLKTMGYRYVHIGSWIGVTEKDPDADVNFQGGYFDEFAGRLINASILRAMDNGVQAEDMRRRLRRTMSYLQSLPGQKGPKFVFAHIICPHSPFVVDKDGNSRPVIYGSTARGPFVEQVQYVNKSMLRFIDRALDNGARPVIILQGDHGILNARELGVDSSDCPRANFGILNALYLPGEGKTKWPEIRTPVNTFRVLFTNYFGADLPCLPERCFMEKSDDEPFHFIEVTAKVLK